MKQSQFELKGIVFDCDGTLADTMPLHWRAWQMITQRHNLHFPQDRFYAFGAVPSRDIRVYLGGQFLRVPKGPAAGLYASQLLSAGRHADLRAMFRLPLLPPLAISALVAYRLTGNDKGVW